MGPFYLNGVQWIDGSIQADIPLRGVSTMFSVSNCIVSQVSDCIHTRAHAYIYMGGCVYADDTGRRQCLTFHIPHNTLP